MTQWDWYHERGIISADLRDAMNLSDLEMAKRRAALLEAISARIAAEFGADKRDSES